MSLNAKYYYSNYKEDRDDNNDDPIDLSGSSSLEITENLESKLTSSEPNLQVDIVETETKITKVQENFVSDEIVQVSKITMCQTESNVNINTLFLSEINQIPTENRNIKFENSKLPKQTEIKIEYLSEKDKLKETKHEKHKKVFKSFFGKKNILMPKQHKKETKKEKGSVEIKAISTIIPPDNTPIIPREILEMEKAEFEILEEPKVWETKVIKKAENLEEKAPKFIEIPTYLDIDVEKQDKTKLKAESTKEKTKAEKKQSELKETKARTIEVTLNELIPDSFLKKEKLSLQKEKKIKQYKTPKVCFEMTAPVLPPIDIKFSSETKESRVKKKKIKQEEYANEMSCFLSKSRQAKKDLIAEERPLESQGVKVKLVKSTEPIVSELVPVSANFDTCIDLDKNLINELEIKQEISILETPKKIEIKQMNEIILPEMLDLSLEFEEIKIECGEVIVEAEEIANKVESQNTFMTQFSFREDIEDITEVIREKSTQELNQQNKSSFKSIMPIFNQTLLGNENEGHKLKKLHKTKETEIDFKSKKPKFFKEKATKIEKLVPEKVLLEIGDVTILGQIHESSKDKTLNLIGPVIELSGLKLGSAMIQHQAKLSKSKEKEATALSYNSRPIKKPKNTKDKLNSKPSEQILGSKPQTIELKRTLNQPVSKNKMGLMQESVIRTDNIITKVIDICPIIDVQKHEVSAIHITETKIDHQIPLSKSCEKQEYIKAEAKTLAPKENELLKSLSKEDKKLIKLKQKEAIIYLIQKAGYDFKYDVKTDTKTKIKEFKSKEKIIIKLFKRIIKITTKQRTKQITYEQFRKKLDKLKSSKLDSNQIDKCFELTKSELENDTLVAHLKASKLEIKEEKQIPVIPAVIEIKPKLCNHDLALDEQENIKKLTLSEANERARILFYNGRVPSIHYNDKRRSFRVSMLTQTINKNGEKKTTEVLVNDQDVSDLLNNYGLFWNDDGIKSLDKNEESPIEKNLNQKETNV